MNQVVERGLRGVDRAATTEADHRVGVMLLQQRRDLCDRARWHVLARVREDGDTPPAERPRHSIEKRRGPQRPAGNDDRALESPALQLVRQTLDRTWTRDDSLETREVERRAICGHRSESYSYPRRNQESGIGTQGWARSKESGLRPQRLVPRSFTSPES